MSNLIFQKGLVGLEFIVTVLDEDGAVVPLNNATTLTIRLKSPVSTTPYTASLLTDGLDGKLVYKTLLSSELSLIGIWKIQAYAETPNWSGHTKIDTFEIEDNL